MATITVSSNPSTTGDTLTVNFTTDATNITDILISKDGGSNYISATSFTNSQAVFNVSSWDNGTYDNCKLKCVYTENSSGGGTTDTYYTISYHLHDSTSSNTSTSIKKDSSYSTTISPKNGYKVNTISCMMDSVDISSSTVNGNTVNIPSVTGDISILVDTEEIGDTNTYYTVHYHLSDSSSTNSTTSVKEGSSYSTTVAPNDGYKIKTIYCIMGGTDISSSTVNGNSINIPNVTGEVYITVITEAIKPDIPDTPIVDDTLEILPSCTYVDIAEGGSKTIYFKLSNKPTSSTTINISSSSSYLTLSTSQLTFTADNYHIAQSVNVTSTSDDNETNDVYNITVSATGLTSKTITVDVIDSSNSNFEVIYDNGTLIQGASFTLNNAVNNGTYISTNQNQDVSVAISNHPLSLNKNDKVHVVLGLGTSEPSSIYSLRSLVLGDGSANNISNSNMINEAQIKDALSNEGKVDTYWTIAADLSNITLTFTCYFARVNIYKIYIERGK